MSQNKALDLLMWL